MKTGNFNFGSLSVRRYLGLSAAVFALAILPGCSDDEPMNDGGNGTPDQTQGEAIKIVDDPALLAGRVINFDLSTSRAGAPPSFSMPEAPTDYSDATQHDGNGSIKDGKYILSNSNCTYKLGLNGNAIVYITGSDVNLNIDYANGSGNKIYVLPNASVTLGTLNNGDYQLYVYGTLKFANNVQLYKGGLYIDGRLDISDKTLEMSNGAELYVDGDVEFKKITIYNGKLVANSVKAEKISMENTDAAINVATFVEATGKDNGKWDPAFKIENGAVNARCLKAPEGSILVKNSPLLTIAKYIGAKNMYLEASAAKVNMGSQAVVELSEELDIPNKGTGFVFSSSADEMGLIKAAVFGGQGQPNNKAEGSTKPIEVECGDAFQGNVYLDFDKVISIVANAVGQECGMQDLQSGVWAKDNPEAKYPYIPADNEGCHGAYGTPSETPVPEPEDFDVVGTTDAHTHPISATCVDIYGNQAFVSWHKRGVGSTNLPADWNTNHDHDGISFWGCIEVVDFTDGKLNITSYMETANTLEAGYDFNHVIYDQTTNSLLTTGDNFKKGGIIGRIQLDGSKNFGKYDQNTSIMQVRHLLQGKGVSGNSVVIRPTDRNLLITAAGGYQTMDYNTNKLFETTKKEVGPYVETAGSVKHVAINGTYAATIEFTQRAGDINVEYDEDDVTTVLPAKITVWNLADFGSKGKEPVKTIDVPAFGPIYGKNVIAIDTDNVIYSCQGHNGVVAYDINGKELRRFEIPKKYKGAAANGLCIDGGNLYVACGAAGVWVLDKTNLDVVKAKYTKQGNASANYVKVADNGYVLVAYGRSGLKLLKPNKAF